MRKLRLIIGIVLIVLVLTLVAWSCGEPEKVGNISSEETTLS